MEIRMTEQKGKVVVEWHDGVISVGIGRVVGSDKIFFSEDYLGDVIACLQKIQKQAQNLGKDE